jgi:MraZ protein
MNSISGLRLVQSGPEAVIVSSLFGLINLVKCKDRESSVDCLPVYNSNWVVESYIKMARFLANTINSIDKKGRVSVPAAFRTVLGNQNSLYTMLSISSATIEAGGPQLIDAAEARLAQMDPFSEEYEIWSFYVHGDSDQLKIDGDGRISLSDAMREHTQIEDKVAFVGRGHFFQLWEPTRFEIYQKETRLKALELRKRLSRASGAATPQGGAVAGERKH